MQILALNLLPVKDFAFICQMFVEKPKKYRKYLLVRRGMNGTGTKGMSRQKNLPFTPNR